jgi:hypothetical protein
MRSPSLQRALVLLCGPPLTWFLHLNALYGAATLACQSGVDLGLTATIASLAAVGALGMVWNTGRSYGDGAGSLAALSRALTALSALAIAWTVLATLLAPRGCI